MPLPRATPSHAPELSPIEPAPLGEGAGSAPTPAGSEGLGWWAGAAAAALALAAVAAAAWLLVRRRGIRGQAALPEAMPAQPTPEPAEVPPVSAPRTPTLDLEFRPTRAGVNLLSATVMGEVMLTNRGSAPLGQVRVEARLIGANVDQDTELRAIHARPLGRLATPPFDLAPGEERRVSVVAVLPHDAIQPLQAGGRPMFVPLVAITAAFEDAGQFRRAGRAFAVGIERVDSAKLAPIWLDGPPRMHDQVGARAHGEPFSA